MRLYAMGLTCLLFLTGIVAGSSPPEAVEFFSFEQDMEGWMPNGTDLELGAGGTIPWSIARSQDRAKDGVASVKFALDNANDQGKIWIQRPFVLQPNQTYQVQVTYFLAPIDSPVGASVIIAGALTSPPTTRDDLVPFFLDTTSHGRSVGANKWARQQYEFTAETDAAGSLNVIIGVWAAFEIGYVYYLDAVRTTFTKRQAGAAEPIINSVDFNGSKRLTINGSAFGPSPRVIINSSDRSDLITVSSNGFIRLRGAASDLFGSRPRTRETI
jgi:hypothetical protein